MSDNPLTVSLLVENTRKHVEDLTASLGPHPLASTTTVIESLHGDLDAIERVLSNARCDLQTQVDKL